MFQVKQTAKSLRIEGLQRLAEIPLPMSECGSHARNICRNPEKYEDAWAVFGALCSPYRRVSMLRDLVPRSLEDKDLKTMKERNGPLISLKFLGSQFELSSGETKDLKAKKQNRMLF
jgi:hypothetical protein